MAANHANVVVTVTYYTTVHPNPLPTTSDSMEVFPIVSEFSSSLEVSPSLTLSSLVRSSLITKASPTTLETLIRSSLTSSLTSSSTTQVSISESKTTLPTGSSSSIPEGSGIKHDDNALLILMMIWLVLVALLFLGGLVYFAWRFLRGDCEDCRQMTTELATLKRRLAGKELITPEMIQRHDTMLQQAEQQENSNQDGEKFVVSEAALKAGVAITMPREAYERGFVIAKDVNKDANTVEPPSAPFPRRMSVRSTGSMHRSDLSVDQNRGQTLQDMTKSHPATQNQNFLEIAAAFKKRTMGIIGLKNYGRRTGVKRPVDEEIAEQQEQEQPNTKLRTFRTYTNPGKAPAPPEPVNRPWNRPVQSNSVQHNPYTMDPSAAYFESTDSNIIDLGVGSSAFPREHTQPVSHFSPVSPLSDVSLEEHTWPKRTAEEMRNKRRTGGYGGFGEPSV